jgi:hypothetical protein
MHGLLRSAVLGAALTLVASPSVNAKTPADASAIAGTWQLNTSASKVVGPALKSETRVYEVKGIKVTMHSVGTDAAGKSVSNSYSAAYDGKPYPTVGNPLGDTIALTKVNSRTVTAIVRKGSKVTATARAVVSNDGKHLTITRKIGTPPGRRVTNTLVYDKH